MKAWIRKWIGVVWTLIGFLSLVYLVGWFFGFGLTFGENLAHRLLGMADTTEITIVLEGRDHGAP